MIKLIMCYPAREEQILGKKGLFGPLAFAYLARHTPEYYKIDLYDEWVGEKFNPNTINADLVAISAVTTVINRAYEFGDILKKRGIKCVIGGPHVSVLTDEALKHFDSVIIGEGETPWREFLNDFEKGDFKKTYFGPMDISLSTLKTPRREFINPNYHLSAINTSRGCPHNCSFCYLSIFKNRKYRTIPHEYILEDLDSINTRNILSITDENFMGFSTRDIEDRKILLEKIIRKKYKFVWGCQTSVRIGNEPELLSLMYKAGCRVIFAGFETTSQESLKEVNKNQNLNFDYKKIVKNIHKHKMAVIASYVIGLDSHHKNYQETLIKEIKETKPDFIKLTFMTAWPGTPLFNKLEKEGRIERNWDNINFEIPFIQFKNFTIDEIIATRNKVFDSFYNTKNITIIVLRNLFKAPILLIVFFLNLIVRWHPRWVAKSPVREIVLP